MTSWALRRSRSSAAATTTTRSDGRSGRSSLAPVRVAETLCQALHSLAEARGGTLAVVGASRSLTWAELEREVVQIASALHAEGVRPGQRVGLMLPRVPELAVTFLALARVGAVVVPINHKLQLKWVVAQLEDIDFLVADPELAKALPTDVAADLRWMTPEHLREVAARSRRRSPRRRRQSST